MALILTNIDSICRLCLKENSAAVNILPKYAPEEINTHIPIAIQIMSCVALEVMENDKLPKAICLQCRYQLEQCYTFKKRSQAADVKLRQHLMSLSMGQPSDLLDKTEFDFEYPLLQDNLNAAFENENNHDKNVIKQMQQEVEEYKSNIERTCKRELKESYKKRLRHDLEVEMRKKLKGELMSEIREECHEEELQRIIKGMEIFLRSEKGKFKRYLKRKHDISNDNPKSKGGGILTLSRLKHRLIRAGYTVEKPNTLATDRLFTKVDDSHVELIGKANNEIVQNHDENSNSTISAVDESNIIVSDLKPEELDEFILTEYDEDENEEETYDMDKNGDPCTTETIEIPQNVVAYTIDLSDMSLPVQEEKRKKSKSAIRLHRLPIEYKSWLRLEKEGFKCKICRIPIKGNRYHIKRHADTAKHRSLYEKLAERSGSIQSVIST